MTEEKQKLTLDRAAMYEIKVPGEMKESWSEWTGGMAIAVTCEGGGMPVTTLTGAVDQAALQGILRRIYARGLPLISVRCVDCR